ncbi:MAG: hypothetical protein M2R45_05142 [Verrucomicrobia subdivision 3 bacterium]|nr:hypothetical protein [Limisphaerales bacterium]MCS1417204.1 hypothetical protein [Limisphaerales bacterium]
MIRTFRTMALISKETTPSKNVLQLRVCTQLKLKSSGKVRCSFPDSSSTHEKKSSHSSTRINGNLPLDGLTPTIYDLDWDSLRRHPCRKMPLNALPLPRTNVAISPPNLQKANKINWPIG